MSADEPIQQMSLIRGHPIPTTMKHARSLQRSNPMFEDHDEVLHPDDLHERYKTVLAENGEWRVFRSDIYGQSGYVYFWNHQLGYGVRFDDVDDSFRNFVHVMMQAAEEVA